jgi:hypothetical protein
LGVIGAAAALAAGQCHQWIQNTSLPPVAEAGCSGVGASSLSVQDLDGPGPLPPELLIGYRNNGLNNASVIRWNGARFLTMPGRVRTLGSDPVFVYDFEPHEETLYLSGSFNSVDSAQTFRAGVSFLRDGVWQRLPSGTGTTTARDVFDLHSAGTLLLMAGQQMNVILPGGTTGSYAAAYNRSANTVSNFFPSTGIGYGSAVTFFGGEYFVGGEVFTTSTVNIVRGQPGAFVGSLTAPGGCIAGTLPVRDFVVYDNSLYAVGNRAGPTIESSAISRWTGTDWAPVGLGSGGGFGPLCDVHGLVDFSGALYAYGSAGSNGQTRPPRLARLIGGQWEQVQVPQQVITCAGGPFFAGVVYNNRLVLANRGFPLLSFYDGAAWDLLPPPIFGGTGFSDMILDGEDVIVTGAASSLWSVAAAQTGVYQTGVARLTSQGWQPVGSGYAPTTGQRILRWGDRLVQATNVGLRLLQNDFWINPIPSITTNIQAFAVWEGDLVIATGGVVHRFDGTNVTELSPVSPPRAFNNSINILYNHQGQLVMGGNFTQVARAGEAAVPVHSLVTWNGQDWVNFSATPLTGSVTSLQSFETDLMLAGTSLALGGVAQVGILRWGGASESWTLTSGHPGAIPSAPVSMSVGAGRLYATSPTTSGFRRFDPATNSWPVVVGSSNPTKILAEPQGRWIHAIGTTASNPGVSVPDIGISGYGRASVGVPILERQPENTVVRAGNPAVFSIDVLTQRTSNDTLTNRTTYQWRRDGVNLVNGTTPHGSVISSATGPWLRISNAQPQDQGVYDCVVTAICPGTPAPTGSTTTSQATLTVNVPVCDSIDFNNDGSLFDPTDVDAFLSVFSEGPCIPALATCNDVDFNNEGPCL